MKIPFDGPWRIDLLSLSTVWGAAIGAIALSSCVDLAKGPALAFQDPSEVMDLFTRCQTPALVTILWLLLYYNFMGIQSGFAAAREFDLIDPTSVTDQFHTVSSRIVGNTLEQGPVFLFSLWMYTLFVDYGTAGPLGFVYLAFRLLYAPCYFLSGGFDVWNEFSTVPQYAIVGIFVLGTLVQTTTTTTTGSSSSLVFVEEWIKAAPVRTALLGLTLSFFGILPGLPFGPILTIFHYQSHQKWKKAKQGGKSE